MFFCGSQVVKCCLVPHSKVNHNDNVFEFCFYCLTSKQIVPITFFKCLILYLFIFDVRDTFIQILINYYFSYICPLQVIMLSTKDLKTI